MPQGRRKVPFSGKAKKLQMQAKKQRQTRVFLGGDPKQEEGKSGIDAESLLQNVRKINLQPNASKSSGNKYALQFLQESKEEILRRKEEARQIIEPLPLEKQEISDNFFPPEIDLPKRPEWDFNTSKDVLDARERRYFTSSSDEIQFTIVYTVRQAYSYQDKLGFAIGPLGIWSIQYLHLKLQEYLKNIEKVNGLSYFELNLETWRQLWRVLEMSDILLIIVDIRYPVLMFPPYLYKYVTEDLGKDMILVLNKIDLAPAALVVAWREYFKIRYPKLSVLVFTSFPTYNLRGNDSDSHGLRIRRLKGKLKMAAEGAKKLLEACEQIVGDGVDLSSWQKKIREEMESENNLDDLERKNDAVELAKADTSFYRHERYKNGVLTIGCLGTPNAGKSSLMNALMGKKVVSVSRTPGHTKHFQTIYLTKTVCLCDCPGLVFPSTVPKQLQIIMGSFPIAQVKEPYTTVKYLAERLDLPRILNIQHQENDESWSAMDICDGWAAKRQYLTARTARFDCYRSANSILRMALDGKICIYAYPPGWSADQEKWAKHPDVEMVKWIQARERENEVPYRESVASTSDEEGSNESEDVYETGDDEGELSEKGEESDEQQSRESSDDDTAIPPATNKFTALATEN